MLTAIVAAPMSSGVRPAIPARARSTVYCRARRRRASLRRLRTGKARERESPAWLAAPAKSSPGRSTASSARAAQGATPRRTRRALLLEFDRCSCKEIEMFPISQARLAAMPTADVFAALASDKRLQVLEWSRTRAHTSRRDGDLVKDGLRRLHRAEARRCPAHGDDAPADARPRRARDLQARRASGPLQARRSRDSRAKKEIRVEL